VALVTDSTTGRVDSALQSLLTLAAELEGELREIDKRRTALQRELGRLKAGTLRAFAGQHPAPPGQV
jgi:hypothetical protein